MTRSKYTFANINFLDRCNLDCKFCLGKDVQKHIKSERSLNKHFRHFPNLVPYLNLLIDNNIQQIYLTGLNTDPLLYKYLKSFIDYLYEWEFYVGIRTNGLQAQKKINVINTCSTCREDAVGYTILTFSPTRLKQMTGRTVIPAWDWILKHTKVPYRVSIVVTRDNITEVEHMIRALAYYRKYGLKYIQLRKVATETRTRMFKKDWEVFETLATELKTAYKIKRKYETAEIISMYDVDVVLWRTIHTTANSMNYFTNGVITGMYEIINGYLRNLKGEHELQTLSPL